ncbi:MAG: TraB/GumN family protein [Bacteroidota bacterium]
MKHSLFLILLGLGMNALFSQNATENQLLWRITSPNNEGTESFLYGTMHVRDSRAFQFSDSVLAALYRSEVFAMEVEPEELMATLFQNPRSLDRSTLQDVLDEKTFEKLDKRFQKQQGFSLKGISATNLRLIDQMMDDGDGREDDKSTFVDGYLYHLARGWEKRVTGIEDVANQLDLVEGKKLTMDQEEIKSYLEWRLKHADEPSHMEQMTQIYEKGDLQSIEDWVDKRYADFKDDLLFKRNLEMADSIQVLVRQAPTFIAVGAAHLPGELGLITLLRKAGFDVSVVPATYTGYKDQFESLPLKPLPWTSYTEPSIGLVYELPLKPNALRDVGKPGQEMKMAMDIGTGYSYMVMGLELPPGKKPQEGAENYFFELMEKVYLQSMEEKGEFELVRSQPLEMPYGVGRETELKEENQDVHMRMRSFISERGLIFLVVFGQGIDPYGKDPE